MTNFTWRGERVSQEVADVAWRALKDCGFDLLGEGNKTVPFEEGHLQESGQVSLDRANMEVVVHYGTGPARAYAVKQHEDTTLRHKNGRRAKWLQLALQENAKRYLSHVATKVKQALGR